MGERNRHCSRPPVNRSLARPGVRGERNDPLRGSPQHRPAAPRSRRVPGGGREAWPGLGRAPVAGTAWVPRHRAGGHVLTCDVPGYAPGIFGLMSNRALPSVLLREHLFLRARGLFSGCCSTGLISLTYSFHFFSSCRWYRLPNILFLPPP